MSVKYDKAKYYRTTIDQCLKCKKLQLGIHCASRQSINNYDWTPKATESDYNVQH